MGAQNHRLKPLIGFRRLGHSRSKQSGGRRVETAETAAGTAHPRQAVAGPHSTSLDAAAQFAFVG